MNNLLHDQRFWAGLVGLIVIVVSSLHPDLEYNLNHIAPAVVGIIGTMIGGFLLGHAAAKHKPGSKDE